MEYAGCWYVQASQQWWQKTYLPIVKSSFHTTILSDMQHTTLKQTFINSTKETIKTCKYSFPIYDGVSVTGFTCEVAGRKLIGVVKEKVQAKAEFDAAVSQGQKAGLLEQSSTADVFSTSLGNVEPGQDVHVTITYIGELKNDFDNDGLRLTIPTRVAPRYGDLPADLRDSNTISSKGIDISIDVVMPKDKPISGLESPSHPVSISLGKLSTDPMDQEPSFSRASATLSEKSDGLDKDFVLLVKAKDTGLPTAILQAHPTLKNHRVLMTSLVPKFSLPSIRPEIVFVADRSGSMEGNIVMLQQAMKVFLKSLPAGVKFNICSFGSNYTFLWPKSQNYTQDTLKQANKHVDTFDANYGGTETLSALEATIKNRYKDIPLEIILLTDGDIWAQDQAFASINKAVIDSRNQIRLFPLGIGNGVSHSLIEGLARAGNGFAQAVQLNERIDTRVVRMLKGALTPHVQNYRLEVKYDSDDDFELIEAVQDGLKLDVPAEAKPKKPGVVKSVISLFNKDADPDKMDTAEDKSTPIPKLSTPKLLQAPYAIPSLYSFSRTTVYLIMAPETVQRNPTSIILKAESEQGPLRLEIPVTILDTPDEAIFQLAARKVVQDLEESRGWVYHATDSSGKKLMDLYPSRAEDIIKQEAVRLGTTYQIANKWCSFIAIEANSPAFNEDKHEEAPPSYAEPEGSSRSAMTYGMATHAVSFVSSPQVARPPSYVLRMRTSGTAVNRAAASYPSPPSGATMGNIEISDDEMEFDALEDEASQESSIDDLGFSASDGSDAAALAKPGMSIGPGTRDRKAEKQRKEAQQSLSRNVAPPPPPAPSSGPVPVPTMDGSLAPQPRSVRAGAGGGTVGGLRHKAKHSSGSFFRKLSSKATSKSFVESEPMGAPGEEAKSLSESDKVHRLISLQEFDGSWQPSDEVRDILGLEDSQLKAHTGNAWMTILTVTFLQKRMAAEREVWELVVEKAVDWLQQQNADQKLFVEAEAFFKA